MVNFVVDLTNNCNLRCRMCCSHDKFSIKQCTFFDTKDYKKTFTRKVLQHSDYIQIGYSCEPLLHNEFDIILKHTRDVYDGTIKIITNGTLLDKYYKEIQDCCSHITVSIDSLRPDRYASIRGANLEKVLKNLSKLDPEKIEIRINITVSRENIDECANMINFFKKKGYFPALLPMSLRQNVNAVILYENCYNTILFSTESKSIFSEIDTMPNRTHILSEDECKRKKKMVYIGTDGNVRMCDRFILGSILDNTLEGIFKLHDGSFQTNNILCPEYCIKREKCQSGRLDKPQDFFDPFIYNLLCQETLTALSLDSSYSDEQRLRFFLQDICGKLDILHVWRTVSGFEFIKLTDFTDILSPKMMRHRYQEDKQKKFVRHWVDIFAEYIDPIELNDINCSGEHELANIPAESTAVFARLQNQYVQNLLCYNNKQLVVWGIGGRYHAMRHIFEGRNILAFATNDTRIHGTQFENRPVIGLEDLGKLDSPVVCVCSFAEHAILLDIRGCYGMSIPVITLWPLEGHIFKSEGNCYV